MKKLLIAFCLMAGFTLAASAQTAKKKEGTAVSLKDTKAAIKTSTPKKADGTPDMRFKENKKTNAEAARLKKDGTPDKRFKANKKTKPKE